MGYPICVYIDEENKDKLKEINNKSELVNELLTSHFNNNRKSKDEIKMELAKIEEKKFKVEREVKEIESIEQKQEEEREKERIEMEKQYEDYYNSTERWDKIKALQIEAFKSWDVDPSRFEEYFNELKEGKVKNLIEWADMHGLLRKAKKVNLLE